MMGRLWADAYKPIRSNFLPSKLSPVSAWSAHDPVKIKKCRTTQWLKLGALALAAFDWKPTKPTQLDDFLWVGPDAFQ